MKKLVHISTLLVMTFVLGACGADQTKEKTPESAFTIILQEEGKEISSEELTFSEGDFLQDVMENNFEILEEDGMISSIDGHASEPDKQKYWMYDVNGKEAQVGAKEYKLEADDTVVWNLSVLDF